MAFNLQLESTGGEEESDNGSQTQSIFVQELESNNDISDSHFSEHSSIEASPEDNKPASLDSPLAPPEDSSSINEERFESPPKKTEIVTPEERDTVPPKEIQLLSPTGTSISETDNIKVKTPAPRPPNTVSGASFTSCRKLSAHETLAARLNRIESDREMLRQEIADMKNSLRETLSAEKSDHTMELGESLEHMQERVSTVEHFLSGFEGASNESIPDENEYQNSMPTTISPPNERATGSNFLKSDTSNLSDNSTNGENAAATTNIMNYGSREEVEFAGQASNSKRTVDSSAEELDHAPNASLAHNRNTDNISSQPTEDRKEINDKNSEHFASGGRAEHNGTYTQLTQTHVHGDTRRESGSSTSLSESVASSTIPRHHSFSKEQGLLLYLLDQEDRFKVNVSQISNRLLELENISAMQRDRIESLQISSSETDQISIEPSSTNEVIPNPSFSVDELNSIRGDLEKLSCNIESKASKEMVKQEIASYLFENSQATEDKDKDQSEPEPKDLSDEALQRLNNNVQRQLKFINDAKVDKHMLSSEISVSQDNMMLTVNASIGRSEAKIEEALRNVQCDVDECKNSIEDMEKRHFTASALSADFDIDERIRDATQAVQSNLNEVLSSQLEGLKQVEDEMEKIASQLAEKPDEEQINTMLQDLELSVFKHVGIDKDLKSVIHTMKTDLTHKMTKEQVLGLVKQLIKGAKEGITKNAANAASLMIGYKCMGCNDIHPEGVNRFIATKVNHNALPSGRNMAHPVYHPYSRQGSDTKMRSLAPLRKKTSTTTLTFRQPRSRLRPRSSPLGYNLHVRRSR